MIHRSIEQIENSIWWEILGKMHESSIINRLLTDRKFGVKNKPQLKRENFKTETWFKHLNFSLHVALHISLN